MPSRRVVNGRSQEPRRRFAEELRLLRSGRGESLRQVGERLGWDPSTFGKMESGESLGSPEIVEALDQHYGTPGLLLTLWELALADQSQFKERYRQYMAREAEARALWHFSVSLLPGLLQTSAYASEIISLHGSSDSELAHHVNARLGRQKLLEGDDAPPFRTIVSEAVLRTPLRCTKAWREQLECLLEAADRPNITVQVLPFAADLHGLASTSLMFLRMPDGTTVAHAENAHRGQLIKESTSVELLLQRYDAMRDQALSPAESRKFIMQLLEELPCEPST